MSKSETLFAKAALLDPLGIWNRAVLQHLASHEVPDVVFGKNREYLHGDIKFEWARWFSEGISDPLNYLDDPSPYAKIYARVREVLVLRLATFTQPQVEELATVIADSLFSTVKAIQSASKRKNYSLSVKQELLDLSGDPARCWICGAEFGQVAVAHFLNGTQDSIGTPLLVDVLRAKGLNARDFRIEVDHVLPFSQGGGDGQNLQLSCGWCNRHRSAFGAVYDAPGRARVAGTNSIGLHSLPQHFWTVRLLAIVGRCEHPDGCSNTSTNSELTIYPDVLGGSLNPWNLSVTCLEHDPLGTDRFKAASHVKELWSNKRVH